MGTNMWMVRAERGGVLFEDFREKSVVAIGWGDLGDIKGENSRDGIAERVRQCWPDWSSYQVGKSAGTLYRFKNEIGVGDSVLTYDPSRRVYLIGKIVGDYEYSALPLTSEALEGEAWPNIRRVDWEGTVPRDQLSVATKNTLGSLVALFLLSDEAADELQRKLKGEEAVAPEPQTVEEEAEEQEAELLHSMQEQSVEFIKDRVLKLGWEDMQELVAGVLRAMGYKTQISKPGADRGKDIIASPDGFGFESPRIVVEVKHRRGTMGSQEIRSFLGGRHKDDKGLYVSTGGFTKDARYEAERGNIPLSLMDSDDLVRAVIDLYDKMDMDSQRLLPLKRLYWPA